MCIRDRRGVHELRRHPGGGAPPALRGSRAAAFRGPCGAYRCLLYTSDAADERSSVDLGGRRILKKKKRQEHAGASAV